MPASDNEETEVPEAGEAEKISWRSGSYWTSSGKERRQYIPAPGLTSPSPGLLPLPFSAPDTGTFAPPGSEYQVLYIADDNEIRSLFPSHPHSAYEQAFQGDESVRIDAMDVHVKAGRVYWTNWHTGTISYRSLPPAAPPTTSNRHRRQIDRGVTHLNVSTPPGMGSPQIGWEDCKEQRVQSRV